MSNTIKLTVGLFLLTIALNVTAQTKKYVLVSETVWSDFNYKSLNNFNEAVSALKDTRFVKKVFTHVKGKFKVYTFIATYKGRSFDGKRKNFHDIIILKTDDKSTIIDGYQYTLEWAEFPLSYDLFKSTAKDIKLANALPVSKLKFTRTDHFEGRENLLNEPGVLYLSKSLS
jgi:hypothetical protein